MKRKMMSVVLIIIGLLIMAYPKTLEIYQNYQQEKLMKQWQGSFLMIDNSDILGAQILQDEAVGEIEEPAIPIQISKDMDGIMTIEKINLILPILKGSTKQNLNKALASIDKTGKPGAVGNYSVAGHRNQKYGSMFNRLDEVAIGDQITIDSGGGVYTYTVEEKLLVKPEETWVLEGNKEDKEITLVTCDPIIGATHRLIIKGKIIEKDSR